MAISTSDEQRKTSISIGRGKREVDVSLETMEIPRMAKLSF